MSEQNVSEQQLQEWVREQFQVANKYMAEKGLMPQRVLETQSRYLAPNIAVWKMMDTNGEMYWVISGEVPTDHIAADAAPDAREAMRSFSLRWQLKAEQILQTQTQDNTQRQFAHMLVTRAEGLYQIFDDEKLWK